MKILWLDENQGMSKISRDYYQMRTEFAWYCASDSMHANLQNLPNIPDNSYDVAIIILPKREDYLYQLSTYSGFDLVGQLRRIAKKVGWMQEGVIKFYHNYPISIQTWFFSTLSALDFLMVHNENDRIYLQSLIPNANVFINRTLMIEDVIPIKLLVKEDKRKGVMIGGNFVGWYGGFDSYVVALEFGTKIYAPSMGRMREDEKEVEGLHHIEYKEWSNWIVALSKMKYAVQMSPSVTAGTFNLNCAYLGIPCIGNEKSDAQNLCFPDLSVDLFRGLGKAKKLAKQLKDNKSFYDHCSDAAKSNYQSIYDEKIWKKNFFNFLEQKIFSGVK
jgi:hypothetical protein